MRITDITRQKRDGYFSIFVDGEFRFSLTDLVLSQSGLRVGQEMSEPDVETWRKKSGESKALGFGYRYLASRARSVVELERYLGRKDFESTEIQYAVTRLTEEGLLGDQRFASDWVDMRQRTSPRSRSRLTAELRQKGISSEAIDEALAPLAGDQVQTITELVVRRRLQTKYAGQQDRLVAYLSRQGFGYSDVRKALESLDVGDAEQMVE